MSTHHRHFDRETAQRARSRSALREGDCFQLFSAGPFYPLDPRPVEIRIEDIAHALSNLCRFGGHCRKFYSVAQHSVLVSRIVSLQLALEGLLHDAAEAYLGDMVRPLKASMPAFSRAEEKVYAAVAEKFNLPPRIHREVARADLVALSTEARDLMAREESIWGKWVGRVRPLPRRIIPLAPPLAEKLFLERFRELTRPAGAKRTNGG
jgi:5'-deoxynucleotidase YfbR-like HD superfamily hydrolase